MIVAPRSLEPPAAPPGAALGLSEAEAAARLREAGPNALPPERPSLLRQLGRRFWAPVPWMLEATIIVQLGLREFLSAAVIFGLLLFNATLGSVEEGRTRAAIAALRKRLAVSATVLRDGQWRQIPASLVVPGDTVRLGLGAIVPADVRVTAGFLSLDQSALTGESMTVDVAAGGTAYSGTLVRHGGATGQVVATGAKTFFGRAAELVKTAGAKSREEEAVAAVTRNLAVGNGALAALVIVYGHLSGMTLAEVAPIVVTILLAAIPVALPAAFTLAAALGALAAARNGVLLARLPAIHDAAGMDVLCTDKTGTLTMNRTAVSEIRPLGETTPAEVLLGALLATPAGSTDPVDAAIEQAARGAGVARDDWVVDLFVPFDPARKYASSDAHREGERLHAVKGAPAALAELARTPDAVWKPLASNLGAGGSRVLAVAAARGDRPVRLIGLVGLSDPARPDSAPLIAELKSLGVRTVMITGDGEATAAAIARQVGIEGEACPADRMRGHPPPVCYGVYAGVFPEDKLRLVRRFQIEGHIVGMCGDGVNDAPALRQAQVGIAVASATDAAKAAAALVLTNPGLADIVAAVREGRRVFRRVSAYTLNTLVKKFEFGLVIAAALFITGRTVMTPLTMVLLLVTNDFITLALVADRVRGAPRPERLAFSLGIILAGYYLLHFGADQLQTLAFLALTFGSQAIVYVVRERGRLWGSLPSFTLIAASASNLAVAATLGATGTLMAPLPPPFIGALLASAVLLAFAADLLKVPLFRALGLA